MLLFFARKFVYSLKGAGQKTAAPGYPLYLFLALAAAKKGCRSYPLCNSQQPPRLSNVTGLAYL